MTSPALKRVSMRQGNTWTASLVEWEEGVTGYCGGNFSQERMTEDDMVTVTSKKEAKIVK